MNHSRLRQLLVVILPVVGMFILAKAWIALQPEQVGRLAWWPQDSSASALPSPRVDPQAPQSSAPAHGHAQPRPRPAPRLEAAPSPPLNLATHLATLHAASDARQRFLAYQALADCATRVADWPVQQMAMTERDRQSQQGYAREALVQGCADVPLDQIVRKASELRAALTASQYPAILAENLADRYRGGVDGEVITSADRLRQHADGATLEALKAFYDAVNRGEPKLDEVVPIRYRPALEAAWFALLCDLGKDCSAQSREWMDQCAHRNLCGLTSINDYLHQVLPEAEVQRAEYYRRLLHARIAEGKFNAVGLAVDVR
jgi:hypothetical protein